MLFFYCWWETKGDREWREQKGLKVSVPKCGVICSIAGVIETWWVDCWVISFQHGCRHCQIYWHSRKSSLRRVLEVSLSPLCLSACLTLACLMLACLMLAWLLTCILYLPTYLPSVRLRFSCIFCCSCWCSFSFYLVYIFVCFFSLPLLSL